MADDRLYSQHFSDSWEGIFFGGTGRRGQHFGQAWGVPQIGAWLRAVAITNRAPISWGIEARVEAMSFRKLGLSGRGVIEA
jgi:hypothetical protein